MKSGAVFLLMLALMNVGYYTSNDMVRAFAGVSLIALGLLSIAPGFIARSGGN